MRYVVIMIVITLAVLAGLGMLWMARETKPEPMAAAPVALATQVWAASRDIPVGTVLTEDMLEKQMWNGDAQAEGFIPVDPQSSVAGRVARAELKAHEPLASAKLSARGDSSFLAASLDKGMRAITLAVDSVSGVAGYIQPGDRVDIVLTHSIPRKAALQGDKPAVSEVLLPDLKVLAVNLRKADAPRAAGPIPNIPMLDSEPPGNITLEMSPEDVLKIRLGERNGELSLALRSVQDAGADEIGEPVTVSGITRYSPDGTTVASLEQEDDGVIIIRGVIGENPSAPTPAAAAPVFPPGLRP